jgi:hypothetical protein
MFAVGEVFDGGGAGDVGEQGGVTTTGGGGGAAGDVNNFAAGPAQPLGDGFYQTEGDLFVAGGDGNGKVGSLAGGG